MNTSCCFTAMFLWLMSSLAYPWNAMGHRLIAQIAYDHLNPKAKQQCNALLSKSTDRDPPCEPGLILSGHISPKGSIRFSAHVSSGRRSKALIKDTFLSAAVWMDVIKFKHNHQYDNLHFIDIPFTQDGSCLPALNSENALTAIEKALTLLKSPKASKAEKALQLRILIHLVGDIHQPLHTITLISHQLPYGDKGGNLFYLENNPIGKNLHQYWDRGGGYLMKKSSLEQKVEQLEMQWSCRDDARAGPKDWIESSHYIGIQEAYSLSPGSCPDKAYQINTQKITQRQMFLAGCRLARLLNAVMP